MRRDRGQQEAGVADGGVGEHPLDVRLAQRAQVPDRERGDHDPGQADLPDVGLARERGHEHPQREHERHHLGRRRHEGGHRRRRALVGVRRPHVERRGVGLEAQADDHHREPHQHEHVVRVALGEAGPDAVELELAARAVGERGAVEQEGGADRSDDQVLEPALQREQVVGLDRDQHVQRQREELQRDERGHEAVGHAEQRHAGGRGQKQHVVLDAALAQVAHAPREGHRDDGRRRTPACGRPRRTRRSAACGQTAPGRRR